MATKKHHHLAQDLPMWKWEKTTENALWKWVFRQGFWVILLTLISSPVFSQSLFVVYFRDKVPGNTFSVSRPEEFLSARSIARRDTQRIVVTAADLPVNRSYINAVRNTGVTVLATSRWLNAALVSARVSAMDTVNQLSCIRASNLVSKANIKNSSPVYFPYGQKSGICRVQSEFGTWTPMARKTFNSRVVNQTQGGNEMLVAVLDAGFPFANLHNATRPLFTNNQVIDAWDFPARDNNPFDDYKHGFEVLSVIAGNDTNTIKGPAYGAKYALYRSEEYAAERPVEMFYWVCAVERADSVGADVISSSLGYSTFDNPAYDVPISTLDGRTTVITKGAQHVARVGMLLCNSAGNEGGDFSRNGLISAPADADSILCIGSVDTALNIASSSSHGPTADGRIKPDLVGFGVSVPVASSFNAGRITYTSGTSFACPFVAGISTVAWQFAKRRFPNYTAQDLIRDLKASARMPVTDNGIPNGTFGWGVPDLERFASIVLSDSKSKIVSNLKIYPNPGSDFLSITNPSNEIKNVKLRTLSGQVVDGEQIIEGEVMKLHTEYLPQGLYIIEVQYNTHSDFQKWVKN